MRVTNNVMINRAIRNINVSYERYQNRLEEASSGCAIQRLSDDPHGAAKAVRIRATLRGVEQHKKNVDTASAEISAYDSTFDKVGNILHRISTLVNAGATSSVTPTEREAMAVEIRQLFDEVVQAGNATYNGKYIFGGTQIDKPPFQVEAGPPEKVTYTGDYGTNAVEIGPGVVISTNLIGDEVFSGNISGGVGVSIFDTLLTVEQHMQSNDVDSLSNIDLKSLSDAEDQILRFRSEMGGKANRLQLVDNRLKEDSISLEGLLSKTEDVDLSQALLRVYEQESVYYAALSSAAKSAQMGLIQFLK